MLEKNIYEFLNQLKLNNNRDWFKKTNRSMMNQDLQ